LIVVKKSKLKSKPEIKEPSIPIPEYAEYDLEDILNIYVCVFLN